MRDEMAIGGHGALASVGDERRSCGVAESASTAEPVSDPLQPYDDAPEPALGTGAGAGERRRYILDDTGFDEVPVKYRKFYRKWRGAGDVLAPNEVICPVCKVVIRSTHELRPDDRVYCMPCMSRLIVVRGASGMLEARVAY